MPAKTTKPDPIYAVGAFGPRSPAKLKPPRKPLARSERAMMARAMNDYHRLRVEMDRRWDANKARYGHAEPAYINPESFTPEQWALYSAERPGAINVVAWRKAMGEPDPVGAEKPDSSPVAVEIQGSLF